MLNPTAPRHGRQVPSLVVAQEAGSYHGRNQPWSAGTGNPFSPSDSVRVYSLWIWCILARDLTEPPEEFAKLQKAVSNLRDSLMEAVGE